jgi:hypothetical protein
MILFPRLENSKEEEEEEEEEETIVHSNRKLLMRWKEIALHSHPWVRSQAVQILWSFKDNMSTHRLEEEEEESQKSTLSRQDVVKIFLHILQKGDDETKNCVEYLSKGIGFFAVDALLDSQEDEEEKEEEGEEEENSTPTDFDFILNQMNFLARKGTFGQQEISFLFYAEFMTSLMTRSIDIDVLSDDQVRSILFPIRIMQAKSFSKGSKLAMLIPLAQQASSKLEQCMGSSSRFLDAVRDVEAKLASKRQERRSRKATLALSNPSLFETKKILKNKKKTLQKQEKKQKRKFGAILVRSEDHKRKEALRPKKKGRSDNTYAKHSDLL